MPTQGPHTHGQGKPKELYVRPNDIVKSQYIALSGVLICEQIQIEPGVRIHQKCAIHCKKVEILAERVRHGDGLDKQQGIVHENSYHGSPIEGPGLLAGSFCA